MEEKEKEIIKSLAEQGLNRKQIEIQLNLTKEQLRNKLKKYNLLNVVNQKIKWKNIDLNKLKELYDKGLTFSEISDIVKIHRSTVVNYLKKIGVKSNFSKIEPVNCTINCNICEKEITNNFRIRTRCGTCNTNIRRYRVKKFAVEYKGGKCENCGWSGDISGFDFHHIESSTKEFNPSGLNLSNRKWEVAKLELDKCKLLCALCHRLEHSNYKNEKFIKEVNNYKGTMFK